ncbi:MAG: UvrB/UvrC motif-containing protein, partial [Clostridia bacterium]|nr:UvrB/UvrC motif-containing protein [Clostridia bacterium]
RNIMMCQKCGKKPVSVHIKKIVNDVYSDEYLCNDCAGSSAMHVTNPFEKGIEELFGNLFASSASGITKSVKCCPLCGATPRDISGSGKVGCAKCYEVFRDQLRSTIGGIHGNVHHVGRAPGNHREMMERQAKLEQLKAEQQKAIEDQNFELAAELRDKIKELSEGRPSENGGSAEEKKGDN